MSLDLSDDKSTLVQVMAWCHQATSNYLSQCWPRSMSPYGVTRPQWVKKVLRHVEHCFFFFIIFFLQHVENEYIHVTSHSGYNFTTNHIDSFIHSSRYCCGLHYLLLGIQLRFSSIGIVNATVIRRSIDVIWFLPTRGEMVLGRNLISPPPV